MLDRSIAPDFGSIQSPNITRCQSTQFPNGIVLHYIPNGAQGVIKLEISLKSGVWYEQMPGLSWFTANMLREGTKNHTSAQIAEVFEYHGAFLEINPGFDNVSIAIFCMKEGLEDVLKLFIDLLSSPSFPEEELNILKNNRSQQIGVNLNKNSFLASREIRKLLFGTDHPYGRSVELDDIPPINQSHIKDYFDRFLQNPEIYLSGDVGDSEVQAVESLFSQLTPQITDASETSNPDSKSELSGYIEKAGSLQSSIRLGIQIPDKSHTDYYKILISNEILGGYFSSRLMKNLREDKGYTYGVHSRPLHLRHSSFLIISTDVIARNTQDALNEIENEIKILQENLVPKDELDVIRNYMAGSFLSSISTPFEVMEKFKSVHQFGLNYSFYDGLFNSLDTISSEEIRDTFQQYLGFHSMSKAIVGSI